MMNTGMETGFLCCGEACLNCAALVNVWEGTAGVQLVMVLGKCDWIDPVRLELLTHSQPGWWHKTESSSGSCSVHGTLYILSFALLKNG